MDARGTRILAGMQSGKAITSIERFKEVGCKGEFCQAENTSAVKVANRLLFQSLFITSYCKIQIEKNLF
jgi:hypothetical protein